jgi:hypothetical protein
MLSMEICSKCRSSYLSKPCNIVQEDGGWLCFSEESRTKWVYQKEDVPKECKKLFEQLLAAERKTC